MINFSLEGCCAKCKEADLRIHTLFLGEDIHKHYTVTCVHENVCHDLIMEELEELKKDEQEE